MKTRLFVAVCATGITLLSTMTNAAVLPLEGRLETALGSGVFLAYYDPNLEITWLADANAGAGSAFDDGFSTTDGKMTWANANAWAASLSIGGVSGWRLPSADVNGDGTVVDCGGGGVAGCEDTEMGFLYWEEGITDDTPGPFSNIQSEDYWSSTAFDSVFAWSFDFDFGFQDESNKEFRDIYAWAVRTGDAPATVVPVPAAALLFGSGLLGLIGISTRKKAA